MIVRLRWLAAALLLASCSGSAPSHSAGSLTIPGRCAPRVTTQQARFSIPNIGFTLAPLGRLTEVGNLPLGGAITPDGRHYWAVDSGYGQDDVQIVDLATGVVIQTLLLPGAYGGMVFSPDGLTAYVSGEPVGKGAVTPPGMVALDGDVIHVFARDAATGLATEQVPIELPATVGGSGRNNSLPPNPTGPAWPVGLALSPDGKTLVVALNMADQAAVISLPSGTGSTVRTGLYPHGAAIERTGRFAFVGNELDGTLTKIDLTDSSTSTVSGLGGRGGDFNAHPQFLLADPRADRLYVTVTSRDAVAVIDTLTDSVLKLISLARPEGPGASPVGLALAPDGATLYVANAGENSIVAIALTARPGGADAYSVLGKIPTADYPHDVQLTPDGCTMVWTAARGIGSVPNPGYRYWTFGPPSPYPSYTPQLLTGQVSVLPLPAESYFARAQATVDAATIPGDGSGARPRTPAATPVVAPDGGPSDQIKYVFYVVKENRSYDQIFGSDPRGDGDPSLEMFDDNGAPAPVGGITPNAHALARQFVLLDRFFEDSEVSLDGHVITSSAYAIDYVVKGIHANYSKRGKPYDFGIFPVSFPPKAFLFDAAVRHSPPVTFRNYGEISGGILNGGAERTDSYPQVLAHTDLSYPNDLQVGCTNTPSGDAPAGAPNSPDCFFDAGLGAAPPLAKSRIDIFRPQFEAQVTAGQVPHFNYLVLPSDHTTGPGNASRDPLAMVADNDLGLGQLVQIVSASSIWPQSVIFVVEDDSQDGADHVDAHRAPAQVIGPWVKHGGQVVHTHYDQYSVIRTIELILGLDPLSMHDANAVPMFDVFTMVPDNTPYHAIPPTQDIQAMCPCGSSTASAALSAALPWDHLDAVPQELSDRLLWQRVHGDDAIPPPPGPNASRAEHERAVEAMRIYRRHAGEPRVARYELTSYLGSGDDD
ncbi:MAG: bifunctional YncE family protein/alkaline phosphatase family protein [bacterium]